MDEQKSKPARLDPESASPYGVGNAPLGERRRLSVDHVAFAEVQGGDLVGGGLVDDHPLTRHAFPPAVDITTLSDEGPVHLDVAGQVPALAEDAPRVIGLCGAAGSGKSTVAAILAEYGYTRLRFAAPLKSALAAILLSAGLGEAEVADMIEGRHKGAPHPALAGQTPRHAMQTLGTEWGRECIGPDFWVSLLRRRMRAILGAGGRVVIEDIRFPNEAAVIPSAGALWLVTGRGGIAGGHASEAGLADLRPDLFLDNGASLEALEASVLAEVLG